MRGGILSLNKMTLNSLKQKDPKLKNSLQRNTYQWQTTCNSPYQF